MRRWAFLTVGLYVLVLAALAWPLAKAAFPHHDIRPHQILLWWPLCVGFGVLGLAQLALLAVPIHIASRRPVTRSPLTWTLLAGLLMTLLLAGGFTVVALETVMRLTDASTGANSRPADLPIAPETAALWAFSILGGLWLIWTFLFGFYCGRSEPQTMMSRIVRWMIAGSVLELLVAVPAHIYARHREDCCGGWLTVWGLAAGIAVMLFAFGPAAFMLFTRRVRSLQPPHPGETQRS